MLNEGGREMARLCGSFLVRWWDLSRGEGRVEIEHIQTGEKAFVGSLAAAAEWIGERGDGRPPRSPPVRYERARLISGVTGDGSDD